MSLVTIHYQRSYSFIICFAACGILPTMSQVSPLCATRFALELQQHPNQALVSEVLQGLLQGFCLGFNPGFSLQSAKKNKASAISTQKLSMLIWQMKLP